MTDQPAFPRGNLTPAQERAIDGIEADELTGNEQAVLLFLYDIEEGLGGDGPGISSEEFDEALVGLLKKEMAEVCLFEEARGLAQKLITERDGDD